MNCNLNVPRVCFWNEIGCFINVYYMDAWKHNIIGRGINEDILITFFNLVISESTTQLYLNFMAVHVHPIKIIN